MPLPLEAAGSAGSIVRLVTAAAFARRVAKDPRTVRRWVRLGLVPGVIIGGRYYVTEQGLEGLAAAAAAVKSPREVGRPKRTTSRLRE